MRACGLKGVIQDKVGPDEQGKSPTAEPCPLPQVVLHLPCHKEQTDAEEFDKYGETGVMVASKVAHGLDDDDPGDDLEE